MPVNAKLAGASSDGLPMEPSSCVALDGGSPTFNPSPGLAALGGL